MKKEKIIMLSALVLVILGFGAFRYFSNNSSEGLCIYEIPNHIKMSCPAGNETRIVNFFELSIYKYNNAASMDCNITEELSDYGYRYEISKFNESIPFKIFR